MAVEKTSAEIIRSLGYVIGITGFKNTTLIIYKQAANVKIIF